jgi:CubicO group peptidase (beta-lactamase class C family)
MTDPYSHSDDTLVYSPGRALDPAAFPSAGAGMAGTAPEMLTFLETVRQGGGAILRPSTTAMMMANQLGGLNPDPDDPGWGFGYGGAILGGDGTGCPHAPGSGAGSMGTSGSWTRTRPPRS